MSKPFNAQQEMLEKEAAQEAERRQAKQQIVGAKLLASAIENELTVIDLQVILNTLTKQLEAVFMSRRCSEFIPKEEVIVVEEKKDEPTA